MTQYLKLKKMFKNKLEKLLFIRASFNKNMVQDILTTATTVHDDFDEEREKLKDIVDLTAKKRVEKFSLGAEIRRPY